MSPVLDIILLLLVLTAEIWVKLGVERHHETVQPVLNIHVHVNIHVTVSCPLLINHWINIVSLSSIQHVLQVWTQTKVEGHVGEVELREDVGGTLAGEGRGGGRLLRYFHTQVLNTLWQI